MLQLRLNDGVQLEPGAKRVPAEAYQTVLDSEAIIARAREEAAQIARQAQEEFEAQKKLGFEEGLEEGRLEMAERMFDSVTKSVDYFSGLEQQMVELVVKALRKILGEYDDRDRVVQVVRSALSVARNQSNVTLRVPPAEAEVARERLDEIVKPYPAIRFLEVTPESRLGPGECILETDLGVVDAGLETQLTAIENSLRKTFEAK